MNIKIIGCGLILMLTLLKGCMSNNVNSANAVYNHSNVEKAVRNNMITMRAYKTLYNNVERLAPSHINVTSVDNNILLTGQTLTSVNKDRIERLMKKIPHVNNIYNQIEISEPTNVKTQMQDTWITTKVKTKIIRNSNLDPNTLKVVTENHVVYLLGNIEEKYMEELIGLATNTKGVNKIVTLLHTYEYTSKA